MPIPTCRASSQFASLFISRTPLDAACKETSSSKVVAVVACPTIVRHTGEIIYSRLTTLHSPSFPLLHAFAVVRIIFVSLEAFVVCPLPPTFQLASRQPVSVIIINHIRGCISAFTFGTSR
ncbi:hypothetical protein TWF225_004896 [Orbilia oligospora]|nr:hypothetical protein TWF225_004896 [Orbilia oligospora]